MSNRKEAQKRRLRKIIREACGEAIQPEMPCPVSTAEKLSAAGASSTDVMNWISELMNAYSSKAEQIHNPLSLVAVERYQRQNRGNNQQTIKKNELRLGSTIPGIGFSK